MATSLTNPGCLLVGPYDPHCGEYTFLAPPLGVWRLAGVLNNAGIRTEVFDPNCCDGPPAEALELKLREGGWDVIGSSTTGMTLRYDLELAHLARRILPNTLIIAGGMEATFKPELMFQLGPFDMVVLGEGEKPLLELIARMRQGENLDAIPGTAVQTASGKLQRYHQRALNKEELRDAIFKTPYEQMPYRAYWEHLERAYRVGALPSKADREARLAEIRSVRLITLNYCPMNCTFCSSTNFLHSAQGGTAGIARLEADECLTMIQRIVAAHPDVRTIIFQDDIFVFTQDHRILPLCESIIRAKERGELPEDLQFISTNRIDAMTPERLAAMRCAGFRVLGFGVENFSLGVLKEFNKSRIYEHIEPNLQKALDLGITPFLDLILTSPRCSLSDLAETIRKGYRRLLAGCEMGMYPYVIPFSGAAMANDTTLEPHTTYTRQQIAGTTIAWDQPSKILPLDPAAHTAILAIEKEFNGWLEFVESRVAHLPSRTRSLIWVLCAVPVLAEAGEVVPDPEEVFEQLLMRLPAMQEEEQKKQGQFAEWLEAIPCVA
ncbi:MAG: B12-binding domain-containing radical SAM protein [Acidobacteria bacterium]|nr:B12-binding domain-containing radical SAM protein [Acidobacteriota bacterium]